MNIRRTYMNRLVALLTIVMMGVSSAMADTWNGTTKTAPDMSTNNGSTEVLAIRISKAAELAWLGDQMRLGNTANGKTYGGKYWKLTAHIDLGGNSDFTGNDWASIIGNDTKAFCGYFNGDGHTVSNIQVASVTSAKYYGLFPSIQGASTTNVSTVKNLNINGVYFKATASIGKTTRIGALAGYAKQADISNIEIKNVTFTYTNTVTDINQLGGAIGCMENNTTLDNVDVTGVTATFSNTTTGLYVGGLVGASTGTANTNSITNCDVKTVKFDHTSNVTGTTYVGGLVGNANTSLNVIKNNTVAGVEKQNNGKSFDVSVKGTTVNFYSGGLLGYTNGGLHEIKNNKVSDAFITLNGNTAGNTYIGGFAGYAIGSNSTVSATQTMGARTVFEGNYVFKPSITINGEVATATLSIGGFIGFVDKHVNILNNKVNSIALSLTNNVSNTSYVGGAIGSMMGSSGVNGYSYANGVIVSGGSINGPSSNMTVKNNVAFFVGGFLGYMQSSGTGAYQPHKFMNIAVTDIDINLGNYVPGSSITNNKFSVGGIAGSINAPNRDANGWCGIPENIIFKGGKIYVPYATTSPTISNFNASNPGYNTMTTEAITSIDALDRSKVKTWYYTDYKLGLSAEFLTSPAVEAYNAASTKDKFRKNYSISPKEENGISYITVKNTTFLRQNRYIDNEIDSWTVLHWTGLAKYAATGAAVTWFTNEEQPIYPHQAGTDAGNATSYPYYWYFFQGVSNATYVTSAVSSKIIEGIEGNFKEAQKEKPLVLTIANSKENVRGFDSRTISVKAVLDGEDVTSNYQYQWYVNGVANGTGSSIKLTPHWKDGQGITLNALKGGVVVATATYTLAPGVLHTMTSYNDQSSEKVRSDINGRGKEANPYIIDCEYALRQWSYLSTAQTGTRWEGTAGSQITNHYNRAFYELGKDITMSNTDFVPISHVGYGSDGTWGSYSNNFIFQGHFDGKLHAIKNLHIKWGAGQYNVNDANIYYGLFGAVGHSAATAKWGEGTTTSNTVIKNLVIDGAVLTHDVSNTTFSYQKDYKHITAANANNCMVGVLAGMVASNTTIQNIEIRNSKITDDGSSEYSLATRGLYVGGAIGSVQSAYNKTDAVPVSLTIDHVAANVNISLKNPVFQSSSAINQICLFNVGGIIGRFITTKGTQDQVKDIMPGYTLFSGNVVAPKAWVSPVLASLRYSSNQALSDKNFATYSQQWEGNNNAANTQLTITNAHYYNYSIDGKLITELYPDNQCAWGARPVTSHADGMGSKETYTAKMYQGVNYGAIWVDAEGSSLKTLNEENVDGIYWVWDNGFVHMTETPCLDAYITSVENPEGTGVELTAMMSDESTGTYRWQESFDGASWIDLDGETLQKYPTAYVSTPKFIVSYVKVDGKEYRTLPFLVHAINMTFRPYLKSEGVDENGDDEDDRFSFEVMWKNDDVPNSSYEVTYQWCQSDGLTPLEGKTANSLELDKAGLDDVGGSVWCVIRINYLGKEIAKFSVRSYIDATVVFVNGTNGNDNNDGSTPETAVKTINHANSLLKTPENGGTWDNNIIVIMGVLTPNSFAFQSNGTNPATLTGKWDGTDHKGVIKLNQIDPVGADGKTTGEHNVNPVHQPGKTGSNCYVLGDTKFENLTFYGNMKGNTFIELHGRNAIFGKGLVMQNFANLSDSHGNMGNNEKIPEFTILLTATNLCEDDIEAYLNNRKEPQVVTFQSGHYGRIMAGRFTQNFFNGYTDKASDSWKDNTAYSILGSAANPVWAVINIDIDNDNEMTDGGSVTYTCDINAIIAGLTDGTMYGDMEINFHGGKVSYIVGANQGNAIRNGKMKYTPEGGVKGVYGQWPNASYFGRSIINVEQNPKLKSINVGHLYAGGLGRKVQSSTNSPSPVDMYLYGRTEVNIKSGTISGNAYGGGTGGVIGINPWDDHLPYECKETLLSSNDSVSAAVMNGVQYGDNRYDSLSWSSKIQGTSPLVKVRLRNRKASGEGYDEEMLDLSKSSTTLNISGGTINGNVYGGGYGEVPDMPIESAMQGIGSVFGTSNITITGGTIDGSVYGGSRGSNQYYKVGKNNYGQTITHVAEMNGTVNLKISGDEFNYPTIGGNIYGAGQGLEAGQRKTTQEDVDEAKKIIEDENYVIGSNPKAETIAALNVGDMIDDDFLRIATTGNKELLGEKHETNVNIEIDLPENAPFNGNIYGGGEFGVVDGNTNIVIKRGTFNGNIFGGGKGKNNDANRNKARVSGSTNVKIGE